MRRVVLAWVAMCLMIGTIMLAQTSDRQPSSTSRQQSTSRTQQQNPNTQWQPSQKSSSSISQSNATSAATERNHRPAADSEPQAGHIGRGQPWLFWIVLVAVVALIIMVTALARSRGRTRVEAVDRERHAS